MLGVVGLLGATLAAGSAEACPVVHEDRLSADTGDPRPLSPLEEENRNVYIVWLVPWAPPRSHSSSYERFGTIRFVYEALSGFSIKVRAEAVTEFERFARNDPLVSMVSRSAFYSNVIGPPPRERRGPRASRRVWPLCG